MGKIGNKIKEEWYGPHKSFIRYATYATAAFLVFECFISDDSLLRWAKAGIEIRQQKAQIQKYRDEIAKMDKQVRMLSNDRDTLEEFARSTFHFSQPDEDVYLIGR